MYLSRLLCPLQDRHQPGLRTAVSVGASSGSNTNCVSANTSPLAVSRGAAALDLRYTAKPLAPHAEPLTISVGLGQIFHARARLCYNKDFQVPLSLTWQPGR